MLAYQSEQDDALVFVYTKNRGLQKALTNTSCVGLYEYDFRGMSKIRIVEQLIGIDLVTRHNRGTASGARS